MLTIISDIHLADETASHNVNPEAFDILAKEIQAAAEENGAKENHVVLLGDIFDLFRTTYWHKYYPDPNDRPWGGKLDVATAMNDKPGLVEQQFNSVLEAILKRPAAEKFIQMLTGLLAPARVTYVLGNHDRPLNNFDSLKNKVAGRISGVKFQNGLDLTADYGLLARHGHEWDEHNNATLLLSKVLQPGQHWSSLDPQVAHFMSIGEVITAELMSGLVYDLETNGPPGLANQVGIRDVSNIRPMTDVFEWLDWRTDQQGLNSAEQEILRKALVKAISGVVDSTFGQTWDKIQSDFLVSGDIVDRLQLVRSFLSKKGSLNSLHFLKDAYEGLRKIVRAPEEDDCYKGALTELQNTDAFPQLQFLLYGHTHEARHDFVRVGSAPAVRLYINTRTYLPLIQKTNNGGAFSMSNQMNIVFVYRRDEDTHNGPKAQPTLDLWNGIQVKTL